MKFKTKNLVQASLIAAIYAALTLFLEPIGFSAVQFRLSEALTVLPAVMPSSIPGLFIGCLIANYFGGTMVDVIFGSLASLLAAISTYLLRRHKLLFPLPPVVFNAIIVGAYVYLLYDNRFTLLGTMISIGVSQLIICYGIGLPLISLIKKNKGLRRIFEIKD